VARSTAEVLVVGSGIAGCAAALGAARAGADVTVVTKAERPEDAATDWAQGGIAVARSDPEQFKQDVIDASGGTADPAAVDTLVANATEAVQDVLIDTVGVEFDRDHAVEADPEDAAGPDAPASDAEYDFGREAAHSADRILHVAAETGTHVLRPFLNYLDDHERVTIREDTAALDLVTHEGRVHGALIDDFDAPADGDTAGAEFVVAGATILATGGIGDCYARTTNPRGSTGDGIAMAALAGADIADMEYVQFHPTVYDGDDPFLVSEAVRGAGAVLRDGDGERFMPAVHPDAELAPRDVVARAVARAIDRTGQVTLDVSDVDFRERFPGLAAKCDDRGVSLPHIPVAPAEHFCCGGVAVDDRGRASLDRLFAAGECARTGVHGANRLASTSLLEGLVWGLRAGEAAAGRDPQPTEPPELLDSDPALPDRFAAEKFTRLRRVMEEHVGLERAPEGLQRATAVLRRLKGEVDAYVRTRTSRSLYELRNASVTALLVARAAAANEQSVGCHYLTSADDADEEGAEPGPDDADQNGDATDGSDDHTAAAPDADAGH
jgi:L-aspartate oxidase